MQPSSLQAYDAEIIRGNLQDDPAQRQVLAYLDAMAEGLKRRRPFRFLGKWAPTPDAVKGLYLWGRVGRGKTRLTELFLSSIPQVPCQRWHFHRFMNHVHAELARMPDTADTLAVLAKRMARKTRLLVLDEFFVTDIGDAMILYRLLEQLTRHGVSFITTSNVPPDELYLHGLQRESFMPCIALLKHQCEVIELASANDYRLRMLKQAATYRVPDNAANTEVLARQFRQLSGKEPAVQTLDINGRILPVLALSDGIVWFHFTALCEGPRSAADYIEIARDFHTVLLSGIPRFDGSNEESARRFVYLIDELYDRHVNLLLSAQADALSLYQGQRLQREFERTGSRLVEMQSTEYLALEHRP